MINEEQSRKIKSLMALAGLRVKDISGPLRCSGVAVTNTIKGRCVSARIRLAIARRLKASVKDLFADYKPPKRRRVKEVA